MVVGLDIFKKYFEQYPDNYIIIGGTACDIIIGEAGFTPRATKDIDIILIAEALSTEFVQQFWKFIKDGDYGDREKCPINVNIIVLKDPRIRTFLFKLNCSQEHLMSLFYHQIHILCQFQWMTIFLVYLLF